MEIESTTATWSAVAPLIEARQQAMAERATNEVQAPDKTTGLGALSRSEEATVDALRQRDREVRDHEQAHARVGGSYAGQPSYTYQTGPDGQRYAVGGEVAIDVAPIDGDPAATVTKMDIVKAAALAPAEPSSADRQVAALADAQRAVALADLVSMSAAERRGEAVDKSV